MGTIHEHIIVGAGVAGCAAAGELQALGAPTPLLLEAQPEPGGLVRSIGVGEAVFDYTGHFLHLARASSPAALPHAGQDDRNWSLVERESAVYIAGRAVPAPFQYHLHSLPPALRRECIEGYERRPAGKPPRSFRDFLLSGFGEGICRKFLFPYNEKLMALPLSRLAPDAARRFFPPPDDERVRRGFRLSEGDPRTGYSDRFWYPRKGGIELLAKGLAAGCAGLRTRCPVERVDLKRRIVGTPEGDFRFRRLLVSMPLKKFCEISSDARLRRLAASLSHTRILCLNLLYRGAFPARLGRPQWIYIPGRDLPFYRLGVYSHLPGDHAPAGHISLYVETAWTGAAASPSTAKHAARIVDVLDRLGWARGADLRVAAANWIDCAYVHFTRRTPAVRDEIFAILRENGVFPIGRYGRWDYLSMEDSIYSGVETVRALLATGL